MEMQQVISVLESIAAGGDANSTEALAAVGAAATLLRGRPPRPAAAGARWTDDEDVRLCREFDAGTALPEIAQQHGRTRSAIELRLVKLGKLEADAVRVRERPA